MLSALTTFVAVFFVGMGLIGLFAPERITAIFGTPALSLAHRNEIRAVYGGFGVAIGALLFFAPSMPAMTAGIYLSVAVALAGMAGGRVVSALLERPSGLYPEWFYFGVETALAAVLVVASQSVVI